MKLLHVIPYFDRQAGGDVAVCYNLSMHLREIGHDVTVATSNRFDADLAKAVTAKGVEFVSFPVKSDIAGYLVTPTMVEWIRGRMDDFDVVHLHGYRTFQNVVVFRNLSKSRTRIVLQPHGTFPRIVEKRLVKLIFDLVWGSRIIRHSSRVIAVSALERTQLVSAGVSPEKIDLLSNGVELNRFNEIPDGKRFRTRYQLGQGKIILYIGRIHRSKGLDVLLNAFAKVREEYDNSRLVIAGSDNGYKKHLTRRSNDLGITDSVSFVGHIEDIAGACADSDVVVYPGPYEIFGLVPFEAVTCLTPVVVAATTGCGEIFEKNDIGYTFRPGDSNHLASTIIRVLENPEEARKKAEMGRDFVLSNLAWNRIVDKLQEIYTSCIRS